MIELRNKNDCCGCHACYNICPVKAISMKEDEEGFLYPEINGDLCINCGKCERVCPNIKKFKLSENSQVYACYIKDFGKRLESASGGFFSLLAEYVLDNNGLVFGAAFDNNWNLNHIMVNNKKDLIGLKGSKYLQSCIGDTYEQAKMSLDNDKLTLFSGTPCQIQGLKKYLGKEYENLITVDLICHGVPSPLVWKKYLDEFNEGRKLVYFRQKDKEKNNSLVYIYDDGFEKSERYDKNSFIKGFINNLYLRLSCYDCKFKGIEKCSDFTLGDFWGLENYDSKFYDKYGISAVIVHTNKANKLLKTLNNKLNIKKSNIGMLLPCNQYLEKSVVLTHKRKKFFKKWNQSGVINTIEKLSKISFPKKVMKIFMTIRYYLRIVLKKMISSFHFKF